MTKNNLLKAEFRAISLLGILAFLEFDLLIVSRNVGYNKQVNGLTSIQKGEYHEEKHKNNVLNVAV